jgi:hypothetical protein
MKLETSTANAIESLIVILILALVHIFVRELRCLRPDTRNALLSAGAGASLAYVLMRILPKLAEKQDDLMASADTGLRGFLEHHAYLVAMIGVVVYYGISRVEAYGAGGADANASRRYRVALIATVIGYGAYSLLIAYLIVHRLHFGLFSLILIALGMGTLFLVSDHGLRKTWPDGYDRWIRWVLSLSLLAGWAIAVWRDVSPNVVALLYAFLAGLMLITTIREKLSTDESGSFWTFLAGVFLFTVLLLILEQTSEMVP